MCKQLYSQLSRYNVVVILFCAVLCLMVQVSDSRADKIAPNFVENRSGKALLESFKRVESEVVKITLSNGLRVLLYKRSWTPIFTGQIWVRVGGVDESPGITGISHLFEHMAFKGTESIGTTDFQAESELLERLETLVASVEPEGNVLESPEYQRIREKLQKLWVSEEFSRIYTKRGAVGLNAGTSKDYTFYTVSLPSVEFELWCRMESERLLKPVFRQFYKEREVVLEERRSRVDDNPSGRMYEALLATAFWAHPNRLPVIGWPSDVGKLTATQVREFYNTYYRPDNMVVVLVGDLEASVVKPVLEKYFGQMPQPSNPLPQVRTVEIPQEGERSVVVEFDANPEMALAFHKPSYPHVDDVYFTVLHQILSDSRSSVLYKELVQKKQIATSVYTSEFPGARYSPVFTVGAHPSDGVSYEKLEAEILGILNRLKVQLVPEQDLDSAKRRMQVDVLGSLASNYGVARSLGYHELLWDDYKLFFRFYESVVETNREDLREIAKKYFVDSKKTKVYLKRPEKH